MEQKATVLISSRPTRSGLSPPSSWRCCLWTRSAFPCLGGTPLALLFLFALFLAPDLNEGFALGLEALVEVLDDLREVLFVLVGELLRLPDVVEDLLVAILHVLQELPLPIGDAVRLDVVDHAAGDGVDHHDLLLDGHGLVLPLL